MWDGVTTSHAHHGDSAAWRVIGKMKETFECCVLETHCAANADHAEPPRNL